MIFEAIGEFFAEIIGQAIFEGFFMGTYRLIKKGIYKLFGIKEKLTEKERIEKRMLYKYFTLKKDVNPLVKKGMKGTVLEIIDLKNLYAEFRDPNDGLIEFENEIVYKIPIRSVKLIKKQNG